MSEDLYLTTLIAVIATVLIVFGLKYASAAYQARARLKSDAAYRDLAEKAAATQTDSAARLAAIEDKLAAVEKILKEVG